MRVSLHYLQHLEVFPLTFHVTGLLLFQQLPFLPFSVNSVSVFINIQIRFDPVNTIDLLDSVTSSWSTQTF